MKNKKQKIENETKTGERDLEAEALKQQLARALADYDNLRKRIERERDESKYLNKLIIVSRLLPVFDMMADAQKHLDDPGLGIALKVLTDTLKEEGIVTILVTVGEVFNPELHEAIDTVLDGGEDNTIAEVTMKGYKFMDGPVIRHAKVKVFKK